jgi:hypothetical protein
MPSVNVGSQTGSKNNSNNNRKEDLIKWRRVKVLKLSSQGHNQSEIVITDAIRFVQTNKETKMGKNLRNLTLAKTKIS